MVVMDVQLFAHHDRVSTTMAAKGSSLMKRSLFTVSAIALALAAGSAFAADLPSRKEAPVYIPPPPPRRCGPASTLV